MVLADTAQTAVRRWMVCFFLNFQPSESTSDLKVMQNCKLQRRKAQRLFWRAERKGTRVLPSTHLLDTDFICVVHGCRSGWWAQVALSHKECFKAVAAPTLLRPRLQAGGEEAAPAWAERAVGSAWSTASLQDFLFHYGNIPGHIQVQSGCHGTFFKIGFMGLFFLIITGIHRKYSPPASLLPMFYVLLFPTLICGYFTVSGISKKSTELCTSDSFW